MQVSKPKKGYKFVDMGFGKFEEIPEEWKEVKIKDIIFDLVGGTPLKPKDFSNKGIPVLHKGDIKSNDSLEIGKTNPFCTEEFAEQFKSHMIDDSYLVVTLRDLVPSGPAIGLMAHSDGKYLLAQGAYGFHVAQDKIDSEFLVHLSNSILYRQYIKTMSVGTTQIHVRIPVFLNMSFWIPPLNEQQKIALTLSNINNSLVKTNQLIQKIESLKKGLMQKLLTKGIGHTKFKKVDWYYNEKIEIPHNWEWIFLDSNCKKITDGSHFSPKSVSEGKYFAAVENVKDFKIDLDSCSKISNDDYQQLVKNGCSPEKNDILFTKDGTIGKSFVFRQSQPIVLLSSIAIIRPKHSLDPDFLNYILQSQYMKKHLQVFVGGTGLRRIILKDIKKLKLPLPPLNEQKQIASILSNVDSQIAKEKLQKSNLEILKKGLMQKLLTGQIRVKF